MEIDTYFEKLGEFGRYNLVLLPLSLFFGGMMPAWNILSSVFIFYEPPHHCKTESDLNISIPLTKEGELEECLMYPDDFNVNHSTVSCQDGWTYDGDSITVVTELDLVCENSIRATTAVSTYFAGVLVSAFFGGHISDVIGRKKMAFVGMTGGLIVGFSLSFTHSYFAFLVLWFFNAVFVARIWSSFFTLLIEAFSSKHRAAATCLLSLSWSFGICILTLIGYFLKNWRHFELAICLPFLLAFPCWWFIVESPRWLISKNRLDDAKVALKKIARFNKIPVEEQTWIDSIEKNLYSTDTKFTRFYTVIDTIRTPRLRKITILLVIIWFVNSMIYYGLSLNSSKIAGDRFINFLVLAVAEIPAGSLALYALPRYGRRRLLFTFHTIVAVACIAVAFIPEKTDSGVNLIPLITTLAFVGKLCISITFTIIWVFSSEIYPTVIRITGVATCSMFARLGGIAAPYIMHLGKLVKWLPMLVFGAISLVAGIAAVPVPETLNQPLPQTVNDVENPNQSVDTENDVVDCDFRIEMKSGP